jgi:hypothetical protein
MSSTPAGFNSEPRRGRSPGRFVIGVLAGLCTPCGLGCEPAPVTLRLTLAEGLGPPSFVRFVFALDDGTVIEEGPIAREALSTERFVEIPPRVSFSIDVIGCLRGEREACEDPLSFVGRGCAGPFSRERDTTLDIEIELLPTTEGNAACPLAPTPASAR